MLRVTLVLSAHDRQTLQHLVKRDPNGVSGHARSMSYGSPRD
jgi:hypothetical protein